MLAAALSNKKGGIGGRLCYEYSNFTYILTNASFGALHTGQFQSSGRSSNVVPSFASSYMYPHTVQRHIINSSEEALNSSR